MASTKTPLVHWVVCDDRAAGPYTHDAARRNLVRVSEVTRGGCGYEHAVVTFGVRPSTVAEIRPLRGEWDDLTITEAHRDEVTSQLADEILRAPVGTSVGTGLIVAEAGWTPENQHRAGASGPEASAAWWQALGAHDDATLTDDGEPVNFSGWCPGHKYATHEVYFERWTTKGRVAHGWACEHCRARTQSG